MPRNGRTRRLRYAVSRGGGGVVLPTTVVFSLSMERRTSQRTCSSLSPAEPPSTVVGDSVASSLTVPNAVVCALCDRLRRNSFPLPGRQFVAEGKLRDHVPTVVGFFIS